MPSSGPRRPRARSALTPLHFHYQSGLTPSLQNPYFYAADCATPARRLRRRRTAAKPFPSPHAGRQSRRSRAVPSEGAEFLRPLPQERRLRPSGPFCPPGRTCVLRYVVSRRNVARTLAPAGLPAGPLIGQLIGPPHFYSKSRSKARRRAHAFPRRLPRGAARPFGPSQNLSAADVCRP